MMDIERCELVEEGVIVVDEGELIIFVEKQKQKWIVLYLICYFGGWWVIDIKNELENFIFILIYFNVCMYFDW